MNYFKYFKKAYFANKSADGGVLSFLKFFLYYAKYGYSIRDFFSCELCHMTNSEILNFISTREILLFYKKFNDLFTENLINNKEKTLDLFRSYIYRDWVCGIDDKRLEEF